MKEFLERYRPLLQHCISQFEAEHSAREDLFQELVLYAFQRLDADSFDPSKGSLGTWLYRVGWCRCVDLKRKRNAQRAPQLASVGDRMPEQPDPSPGPGDVVGDAEIGGMVQRGLAELPAEDQRLLDLRFVQGQTLGQVARGLDISLEQTKYRLKRASGHLRKVLLNRFAMEEATQ